MMEAQKRMWLSKQEKADHIAAWQESKLSKREYCTGKQIRYSTFLNWLGRKKRGLSKSKQTAEKFIPVEVNQTVLAESSFATISCGSNLKIELHQSVTASFIKELLLSCK